MKRVFLILIFSTLYWAGNAQYCCPKGDKKEYIDRERIPYFTTYLNLTPKEAEKFWPLYNQYISEKEDIYRRMRDIKRRLKEVGNTLPEKEAYQLNEEYIKLLGEEYKLVKEYNEKFKKILPMYKVNKLYFAERDFRRYLLKKMRRRR